MTVATVSTASAQATRTWVSGVGDDANPCSRTAPCETFAAAINNTAAGGIVDVLDPGDYGPVTITQSVTIRAADVEGAIGVGSGTGITVNSATAKVALIGLNLDGTSSNAGLGIDVANVGQLLIENCTIAGFRTAGIRVSSANAARVTVSDSVLTNNAVGIAVDATGTQLNRVLLDNVLVDGNTTNATVNQSFGALIARRSTLINAPITLTNGGAFRSFGDNAIGGATPTFTTPLQ